MSVYNLCQGISALQGAGVIGTSTNPIISAPASESGSGSPPSVQAFVLLVTGSGSVSATAQIVGSNDGVNFVNYGAAIVASAATTVSAQGQGGIVPYQFYAAYITAISGGGAVASVNVSM